jgi:hypothetical protein
MAGYEWAIPASSGAVAIIVPYLTFRFTRAQTTEARRFDRRSHLYGELLAAMSVKAEEAEWKGSTVRPVQQYEPVMTDAEFRRVVAGIQMFGSPEVAEIYSRFRGAISAVDAEDQTAEVQGMVAGNEGVAESRRKARHAAKLARDTFGELEAQISNEFQPRTSWLRQRLTGRRARR